MPTAAENLGTTSTKQQRSEAISSCISQLSSERPDMPHDQVVAACTNMANKAMGHGDSKV